MDCLSFGQYIRLLRKEKNLSLRIVSAEIDIDQSTLSKIERGEKLAPPYIVKPLAKLFQKEYSDFQTRYLSERIFLELKDFEFASEAINMASKRLALKSTEADKPDEKSIIINKLKAYLSDSPFHKAWVFGSITRDDFREESDVDILVELKEFAELDLLDYIAITYELEELLERKVDLVVVGTLIENAKKSVDQDKILVHG